MTSARAALWSQGIIASWYLRDDQLPIYELLIRTKRPFVECARRYGKTTTILCYVLEQLIQNPGWVCLWCEPDKNQAREIVQPEIEKLFMDAPSHTRPIWNTTDSYYWFPSTGRKGRASKLKLRGVNHDRGDSARGPFANIIVADEYGTWVDPGYTIREALAPQLLTTHGPLIKASTPPDDLGHPYYTEKKEAIEGSRFIQRIVYDNKSLTKGQFAQIVEDCQGIETPAFRREYLCEPVTDPNKTVIPEYDEQVHDLEDSHARPECFDAYVGMDLGLNDNTAALFGYVDFRTRTLVIEDEYVAHGRNTGQIVEACRAKEAALWGTLACRCELHFQNEGMKRCSEHGIQPYMRWSDNEMQQLHDMATQHGYIVSATRKDEKLSAINELRLLFTQGRIRIKKRCENLRFQLKVGIWNDRKTDFKRGENTGHLDAIDALVYLSRNISWTHNPYPRYAGHVNFTTHFIPDLDPQGTARDKDLLQVFEPFSGAIGEQNRN